MLARRARPTEIVLRGDTRRLDSVALTICSVCGRSISPRTEREYETMVAVGVHDGECWQALKRG